MPSAPDVLPAIDHTDKIAHFIAYFVLCFTYALGFLRNQVAHPLLTAFLLSVAFGASDEWHQSFVPNRTMTLDDLLADCAGALGCVLVFTLFDSYLCRFFRPKMQR